MLHRLYRRGRKAYLAAWRLQDEQLVRTVAIERYTREAKRHGYIVLNSEATRAAYAYQVHLNIIARVGAGGWKRIGPHEHFILESERDD